MIIWITENCFGIALPVTEWWMSFLFVSDAIACKMYLFIACCAMPDLIRVSWVYQTALDLSVLGSQTVKGNNIG